MTPEELEIMDSGLGDDEDSAEDRDDGDEDEIVIVDHKKAKADEKEEDGDEDDEADDEEPAEDDETKDAAGADDGSGDGTEDPSDAPETDLCPARGSSGAPRGLDIRFAELETKFDEGDIQRAEYAAENRKLMREQADLDREQMRADTALDAYQARVSAMWKDAFDKHMAWAATAEGGGGEVRPERVAARPARRRGRQDRRREPIWPLAAVWRQADAAVRESLGLNMPDVQARPQSNQPWMTRQRSRPRPTRPRRTQDKSQVPQNLGGVTGESADRM